MSDVKFPEVQVNNAQQEFSGEVASPEVIVVVMGMIVGIAGAGNWYCDNPGFPEFQLGL